MRDGGVRVMWSETAYAGTPALWYLLLWPLAAAGLPYLAQQLLNLVLIWCAMALFVARSPFHPAVKGLFLFSYYALIEYAVQARPYALLIAILFGIAASWSGREERPLRIAVLTALLANATVHGLLIGAVIGLVFLGEAVARRWIVRPQTAGAVALMLGGGILSLMQLRLPGGFPSVHRYIDPGTVPWAIGSAFLPRVDPRLSFAAGLIMLLLAVLAIGNRMVPLLFLTLTISALLVLFVYVWVGGLRHTGLILVVMFAAIWMAGTIEESWRRKTMRILEVALVMSFGWSIYVAGVEAVAETKWSHSGSKEMAAYIRVNVSPDTVIVTPVPNAFESVLVYLPGRKFWYARYGQFGSYVKWNALGAAPSREKSVDVPTAIKQARQQFGRRPWLLLVTPELPTSSQKGFTLLFKSQQTVYAVAAERFALYRPE